MLSYACEDADLHARARKQGTTFYYDPKIQSSHYVRGTLSGLSAQKWRNGAAVSSLAILNPGTLRIGHLVPMVWVGLVLGLALAASMGVPHTGEALVGCIATYALTVILIMLYHCKEHGILHTLGAMYVVLRVHFIYGLGSWYGLFTFWRDWGKPVESLQEEASESP